MKCVYWNTKSIEYLQLIIDILVCECPDVFFLSETHLEFLVINEAHFFKLGYEIFSNPGCERVKILKKMNVDVELSVQSKYYTSIKDKNTETYIVSIHFPSTMFQHIDGLKKFIRNFRNEIDSEIGDSLNERILIIGDFNVNPFEKPMIDFDGFLATNSPNGRKEITHLDESRSSYFNPTWKLYSRGHFPGTMHFKRPSGFSFDILEFHYLDQVVVSQKLKSDLVYERIEVIERIGETNFFDVKKNAIIGSDHLPILYEYNTI